MLVLRKGNTMKRILLAALLLLLSSVAISAETVHLYAGKTAPAKTEAKGTINAAEVKGRTKDEGKKAAKKAEAATKKVNKIE